jgi:hypothetical protein
MHKAASVLLLLLGTALNTAVAGRQLQSAATQPLEDDLPR